MFCESSRVNLDNQSPSMLMWSHSQIKFGSQPALSCCQHVTQNNQCSVVIAWNLTLTQPIPEAELDYLYPTVFKFWTDMICLANGDIISAVHQGRSGFFFPRRPMEWNSHKNMTVPNFNICLGSGGRGTPQAYVCFYVCSMAPVHPLKTTNKSIVCLQSCWPVSGVWDWLGCLSIYFISETLITPEVFSEVLCDDLDLPLASFVPAIAQAIRQQVKQFSAEPEIVLDEQTDQRVIIKVTHPTTQYNEPSILHLCSSPLTISVRGGGW